MQASSWSPSMLQNQLAIAGRALEVADAELRQASQQAVFDGESKARLAILRSRRAIGPR